MTNPLPGAWALILGASSGMGAATARALAAEGVHIIGVHLDRAEAEPAVEALRSELTGYGVQAHFFNINAARAQSRAGVVARVAELTGGSGVRVLLHSLAFGSLLPYLPREGFAESLSAKQMTMTLDVMAHSLVYWVQDLAGAGLLPYGAQVLAMTSAGVAQTLPSYGAVSAAKAALESHVRQLACELAHQGVAVNALRAGTTITPALRQIPEHQTFVAQAASVNPHGRLTEPADVAEAVVLLSRASSSWITGNTIGVDGAELISAGTAWGANKDD
ncbi:SDR family oxidoreductase [Paractinoplanes rishiriensis]|uniref:Short-chain dehydrogenase n=1 Tax=Paractinoplanes rishiriensis TaxID=1050105 RepID=A0A919N022_9ACTN|nr:SDR family oxidoreductase [Actinoplanes rishiriensis]GIF02264.1 short-chain dehydrogenase [Actinoplanes rishiriensis]